LRSRDMSTRSCLVFWSGILSSAPPNQETTNTRSPQTIGEEWPLPGISTFQAMFSPVLPFHLVGMFFSVLEPSPIGPRHMGQLVSAAKRAGGRRRKRAGRRRGMAGRVKGGRGDTENAEDTVVRG